MYNEKRKTGQRTTSPSTQRQRCDRNIYKDQCKTDHKDGETCNVDQNNERQAAPSGKTKTEHIKTNIKAMNDERRKDKMFLTRPFRVP